MKEIKFTTVKEGEIDVDFSALGTDAEGFENALKVGDVYVLNIKDRSYSDARLMMEKWTEIFPDKPIVILGEGETIHRIQVSE